ncbi:MAG: EAL domain-containing response regulator [Pseudomonadota bacterium]
MFCTPQVDISPSILVLDDDPVAVEEIYEILELEDLAATTATCVDAAMQCLGTNPDISLIVTDMHLIGPNGIQSLGVEFVERARQSFPDRHLRFIVLSGDAGAIGSSMKKGAVDFLTKPLLPESLLEAVERALEAESASADLSQTLMRKVEETTKSLQRVTTDLAARELELSTSREDYDRRRLQGGRLRQALNAGQIVPWFQPQVCTFSGRLLGFEVLVRWIDLVHGAQNPGEFLPLAAEIGLMAELDTIVQRKAFEAFAGFRDHGVEGCDLGINVTPMQLSDPGFVDQLGLEIDRFGIANEQLSIEILESVMLESEDAAPIKETVNRLGALGFGIELDDFGTGHSGLSSLRDLPVTRIKIDRSFVDGVHLDRNLQKFTRALIALARSLEISVLAEGIERVEELAWLAAEGCTAVQGFYIARPMPATEALDWALQNKTKHVPQSSRPRSEVCKILHNKTQVCTDRAKF